jgi:MOSC domain-containing protein YiiM
VTRSETGPGGGEGRIVHVNVSPGGLPKRPVAEARVTWLGIEGDAHRNTEHHGGPERALCLFALEQIRVLQAEGHPIAPGGIGENVTVEGLHWDAVSPGQQLLLGSDVVVQITRYASPCLQIRASFRGGDFSRVSQKLHASQSRVYARVLRMGTIRAGDTVRLLREGEAAAFPGRAAGYLP